jgi:hypothetical protein
MTARRLAWTALVLLLTAHTLYQKADAAHVAPLIRDINMANLAAGERELNIAIDPLNPNRMMAGSNQRPGTQHWFASIDGGRTWTNGNLPNGTLTVPGTTVTLMSDPSLMYGNDGTMYYSALMHGNSGEPCTLFVTATTDQGANWTDPANGIVAAGGASDCQDKEHIHVDPANNNVYVAWTPIGATNNQEVVFSRDLNGVGDGFAFAAQTVLTTDAAFNGCLNQGADFTMAGARLYLAWTSFCSGFGHGDPGSVWVTFSDNQGGAWSAPVQVGTLDNVDFTGQGFRSRSFPAIDADAGGRVFVVWASNTDAGAADDSDVYITSSTDGTTWTAPAVVNADPGGGDEDEQWMPWVAVGQGRVHVVYYCWDDEGTSINACFAYGNNVANPTFTEVVLSSAPTPTATGFLGDYNGVAVSSDNVVFPAWGDGRAGTGGTTDAWTARVDFSPPTLVTLSGPAALPWGQSATFTATVTGAHGEDEQFIPVEFTVTGGGSPSPASGSGTTDAAGEASFTFSNGVASSNTVEAWADLNENGVEDAGETTTAMITWTKHPTTTTYTGPASGTYSDGVTFSGTLVDALTSGALAGETLTFAVGVDTCAGVTDVFGIAACSTVLTQVPGAYMVTATFAGSAQYEPSSDSAPFEILKETTILTYTGPTLIANHLPIALSAVLVEDDGPPVAGRTVDLTLGSGASAQTCSGVTDIAGVASCVIAVVNQPLGPGTVSSSFAGDAYYLPSSDSDSVIVFQWTTGGNFVIGDGNAAIGSTATFWSSQWSAANSVSGGPAPDSFKGFSNVPAGPTVCGGTFSTTGGNSPPPPGEVPSYTAMLVTSSVGKTGNIVTGTKPAIVVVRTNPGYGPSPGHAGTAEVLAVLCSL